VKVKQIFLSLGFLLLMFGTAQADAGKVVLKDGTSIEATSVALVHGQVQLKLANGRFLAFDAEDVNLEASGLTPTAPPAKASEQPKAAANSTGGMDGRFGKAIARSTEGKDKLQITDQDVKHVRPETADEEVEKKEEPRVHLDVSGLNHVLKNGILTVTGTVANTGTEEVSAISITAEAEDLENKAVAQGTTGISSTLKAGESKPFAIAMAVQGAVANIKVHARAALTNFKSKEKPAPDEAASEEIPAY